METQPTISRPWAFLVAALLLGATAGFVGGFAASGFHRGPVGKVGPAGPPGPAGPQGARGFNGNDIDPSELGVCWDSRVNTSGSQFYVSSAYLSAPLKRANGSTYCQAGEYVPVAPQKAP